MHVKGVATNNEPAANAFYNQYAPVRYSERRAFPDVKALEELFVKTTLALLSSFPVRLAKNALRALVYTPSKPSAALPWRCHRIFGTPDILHPLSKYPRIFGTPFG